MRHLKFFILFLLIAGTALLVSYKLYEANLPVATVNGEEIRKEDFLASYAANYNYYYAAAKTYGNLDTFASPEVVQELKRATLDQLIENTLISRALKERLGNSYGTVVENKVREVESNQDFRNAATAIYGISFDELVRRVLIPMAESELLEGRLFVEQISPEDWLTKAKEGAEVTILDSNFAWSKNGVIAR